MNGMNYKQKVAEIRLAERQSIIKVLKIVLIGFIVITAGVSLFELIIGARIDQPLSWHVERAVGMSFVVVVFILFKFTTERSMYEADIGRLIIGRYTEKFALDYPAAVSVEALYELNGKTYSQLSQAEKGLLAKAVMENTCSYDWVLSHDDLVAIAKTENISQLASVMSKSEEIINTKNTTVLKRYNKVSLSTKPTTRGN